MTQTALENFLAPTCELSIGGKKFQLIFDFNAVAEVEERTGRNLMTKDGWDKLNGTTISILLWACLQANHPDVTLLAVRKLMNSKNLTQVTDKIKEAWLLSKADEVEADQNPQ
jgi:hypothetical protein